MTETLKTISPVDGRIYVERPLGTAAGIDRALDSARRAQRTWATLPLEARCEMLGRAVASAGVPPGVFQYLHLSHADTARLIGDPRVASICFTGSVAGGRAVVAAAAAGFAGAGLELGGKDPAYVRADANLAHAIDTLT